VSFVARRGFSVCPWLRFFPWSWYWPRASTLLSQRVLACDDSPVCPGRKQALESGNRARISRGVVPFQQQLGELPACLRAKNWSSLCLCGNELFVLSTRLFDHPYQLSLRRLAHCFVPVRSLESS